MRTRAFYKAYIHVYIYQQHFFQSVYQRQKPSPQPVSTIAAAMYVCKDLPQPLGYRYLHVLLCLLSYLAIRQLFIVICPHQSGLIHFLSFLHDVDQLELIWTLYKWHKCFRIATRHYSIGNSRLADFAQFLSRHFNIIRIFTYDFPL